MLRKRFTLRVVLSWSNKPVLLGCFSLWRWLTCADAFCSHFLQVRKKACICKMDDCHRATLCGHVKNEEAFSPCDKAFVVNWLHYHYMLLCPQIKAKWRNREGRKRGEPRRTEHGCLSYSECLVFYWDQIEMERMSQCTYWLVRLLTTITFPWVTHPASRPKKQKLSLLGN